jgi:hypothetical protein
MTDGLQRLEKTSKVTNEEFTTSVTNACIMDAVFLLSTIEENDIHEKKSNQRNIERLGARNRLRSGWSFLWG